MEKVGGEGEEKGIGMGGAGGQGSGEKGICVMYKNGFCKLGEKCPNSHEVSSELLLTLYTLLILILLHFILNFTHLFF